GSLDRRPHPLPRGRLGRARARQHDAERGARGDELARLMIRIALKGMARRKLRTALTAIAIVLGVALITGTYVLTDSVEGAFGGIFQQVYRGTDATVTGKSPVGKCSGATCPPFAESLLEKVRAMPDVAAAVGGVGGYAHII